MKWRHFRFNQTNLHDQSGLFDITFQPSLWLRFNLCQCFHPFSLLWLQCSIYVFCLFISQICSRYVFLFVYFPSVYLLHSGARLQCLLRREPISLILMSGGDRGNVSGGALERGSLVGAESLKLAEAHHYLLHSSSPHSPTHARADGGDMN